MVWIIAIAVAILILQAVIALAAAGGSTTVKDIGSLRERLTTRGRITIFCVIASAVLGIVKELITSAAIEERDDKIRIQIGEINHLKETINNYELGKLAPGKTSLRKSILGEWELSDIELQNLVELKKRMGEKKAESLWMGMGVFNQYRFFGSKMSLNFRDDFSIAAYTISKHTGEVEPAEFFFNTYRIENDSLFLDDNLFSYKIGENGNRLILLDKCWRIQLTKF